MELEERSARVIINCDDLGMSPGINQAIKQLYQQGRVSSTSLIVNTHWSAEAMAFARQAPELHVGVHLNLSSGHPIIDVEDIPTLVDSSGSFLDVSAFLSRYIAGRIRIGQVRKELEAQIETCIDGGLQPSHLDSHMHFHAVPSLAELVVDLARQYDIPLVRNPDLSAFVVPPMGAEGQVQDAIYKACGRLLSATQSIFSRHGNGPDSPASHSDSLIYLRWCLRDGGDPEARFQACIDRLNGRTLEIVAHPAASDDILPTMSRYVDGRQQELSFLASESFIELLRKNQLLLI